MIGRILVNLVIFGGIGILGAFLVDDHFGHQGEERELWGTTVVIACLVTGVLVGMAQARRQSKPADPQGHEPQQKEG